MSSLFSLKNKVCVVTGATGLLGKEHCRALSEQGATVVVCDQIEASCAKVARELGNESVGVAMDVTSKTSITEVREELISRFGRIDVLINNAAINDKCEAITLSLEESSPENFPSELWDKTFAVNVRGLFLCTQVFGVYMVSKRKGSIINIASTYGVIAPDPNLYRRPDGTFFHYKSPAYCASKAAVISLTQFFASYWGTYGVRVNTLSPGGVENGQEAFFVENYAMRTPLKRMAERGDYRGALLFLASEASAYMTGANLIVDGGFTAR